MLLKIQELFDHYVDHPDNVDWSGSPDWDYVEADIMMHLGVDNIIEAMGSLKEFYSVFNSLASNWKHHHDS